MSVPTASVANDSEPDEADESPGAATGKRWRATLRNRRGEAVGMDKAEALTGLREEENRQKASGKESVPAFAKAYRDKARAGEAGAFAPGDDQATGTSGPGGGGEPPAVPPRGGGSVGGADEGGLGPLVPAASDIPDVESYDYRGPIGHASSARTEPPLPEDILRTAEVASADWPADELDKYFETQAERDLAQILRDRYGVKLRSVEGRNKPGVRTPDAVTIDGVQGVEMKEASSDRAVRTHLRWAMQQADTVVIDARRTSPDAARAGLDAALRQYGGHYREILLVLRGGRAVRWAHG